MFRLMKCSIEPLKCKKCEEDKKEDEFYLRKWGRDLICKACKIADVKAYFKTDKGKAVKKAGDVKYAKTEKGKLSQKKRSAKYLKTDNGKAALRRGAVKYRKKMQCH